MRPIHVIITILISFVIALLVLAAINDDTNKK